MGCTHPLGVEEIRGSDGRHGVICRVCKSVAFEHDSLWTLIKRNIFGRNV